MTPPAFTALRTVYYGGKRYDVADHQTFTRVSIWQGNVITPESGSNHKFYRFRQHLGR